MIIESKFGDKGLLCLEDVVKQMFEAGTHFELLNEFMFPFKLSAPKGGFRRIKTSFEKNGSWGCRKEKINSLIRKIL